MTEELKYLTKCWENCTEREIDVLLHTIRRYSDAKLRSINVFASASIPRVNLTSEQTESRSEHRQMEVQDDPQNKCMNTMFHQLYLQ